MERGEGEMEGERKRKRKRKGVGKDSQRRNFVTNRYCMVLCFPHLGSIENLKSSKN